MSQFAQLQRPTNIRRFTPVHHTYLLVCDGPMDVTNPSAFTTLLSINQITSIAPDVDYSPRRMAAGLSPDYLCTLYVEQEYCYLCMVSVTTAIYLSFRIGHQPSSFTLRHWAVFAPYTSPIGFAGSYDFVKQSHRPFICHRVFLLPLFSLYLSYGVILPSSFMVVLSMPICAYIRPPVSVSCTVASFSVFSRARLYPPYYSFQ
jgi:hypothetical protein